MNEITDEMMTTGGMARVGEYRLSSYGSAFVNLVHSTYDQGTVEMNGWKFHITLDEGDRDKLLIAYQLPLILIQTGRRYLKQSQEY